MRPTLVIMAKRPEAGRVKTRLARDVGSVEALRLYRLLLRATCRRLAADRRWQSVLALSPDRQGARLRLPVARVIGQGGGDLGERMQRLFDKVGQGPLVIVGADIPSVTPAMIARAFHLLNGHDAVFGPAHDGGYWLVGLSRRRARLSLFDHVRWSSPEALADTLANLKGRRVAFVDTLNDIDTAADLRHLTSSSAVRFSR